MALTPCPSDTFFDTYLQTWSSSFVCSIPADSLSSKQSFWGRAGVLQDRAIVEAGLESSEETHSILPWVVISEVVSKLVSDMAFGR